MAPKKQRLDEIDFSTANKRLNRKTGDIARFQSSVTITLYTLLLHDNSGKAKGFYEDAAKIAGRYSREEMPEMHGLLAQLKRKYGF